MRLQIGMLHNAFEARHGTKICEISVVGTCPKDVRHEIACLRIAMSLQQDSATVDSHCGFLLGTHARALDRKANPDKEARR